jgi:hypothetical protein
MAAPQPTLNRHAYLQESLVSFWFEVPDRSYYVGALPRAAVLPQ